MGASVRNKWEVLVSIGGRDTGVGDAWGGITDKSTEFILSGEDLFLQDSLS
jgi:hypothetical protein